MDITKLEQALKDEPRFRLQQAKQAVFGGLIGDWGEAISLPLELRTRLNQECPLAIKARVLTASDGQSQKAVVELADGLLVETVLMKHKTGRDACPERSRRTVCVSSQAGCAAGCLFCLTGQQGFKRNLTTDEIVEQVLLWARLLAKEGGRVSNIVLMGMGEPLLNYDNVMAAIKILNAKSGMGIGIRHISISTVGIPEGIKKLAQEKLKPNLALSLHAANDQLRSRLIPLNKTYPLSEVGAALVEYIKKTRQRVTFEYLLLKGYNDSKADAEALVGFVKQFYRPASFPQERGFYFVNLIAYNPIEFARGAQDFRPSDKETIKEFKQFLEQEGIEVVQRYKFGQDIKGACGQLVGKRIMN